MTWVWSDHPEKHKRLQGSTRFCLLQAPQLSKKSQQMDYLYLTLCVFNACLSYTATMLNIVAIYAIRKTLSLPKNFKTLLLSLAVSDLGVGLLAQPMYVAYIMDSRQNNATNDTNYVIYHAHRIPLTMFISASLFSVTALCVDRFLAIHLHLRYQELATNKRVAAVVVLIWVTSALSSVIRFFIPKNIMYVSFVIIDAGCIITATSLSVKLYLTLIRHINQTQVPQVAQNNQRESVQRKRKFAMASLYVYLVFIVCYLPNDCALIIIATNSEPRIDVNHLRFYTLTLLFLNSTVNPLIYCWKMKRIQYTIVDTLRNLCSSPT